RLVSDWSSDVCSSDLHSRSNAACKPGKGEPDIPLEEQDIDQALRPRPLDMSRVASPFGRVHLPVSMKLRSRSKENNVKVEFTRASGLTCGFVALLLAATPAVADPSVAEFGVPTPISGPTLITLGSDGALWFTEQAANKIGRVTTNGEFKEFAIPTPDSRPYGIGAGPDGNIWYLGFSSNKIGRITPSGEITEFDVPFPDSQPISIVQGPDNAMWFTGKNYGNVARL